MQILEHRWPPNTGRHSLSRTQRGMLTLALALTMLLVSAAFYQLPQAHAASSTPIIHWDPSMIYHGQNHGNPWGPVGEIAVVHAEGFTAGQPLRLIVVPGDSNKDATKCHPTSFSSPNSAVVGQVTVSSYLATSTQPSPGLARLVRPAQTWKRVFARSAPPTILLSARMMMDHSPSLVVLNHHSTSPRPARQLAVASRSQDRAGCHRSH
jgi:hypothetical protein